jgi:NifU-like protein involved in Fe-S cluster formation
MELKQIYTQIITENSRSKENKHEVEHATHVLEGVNPTCGDEITLELQGQGRGHRGRGLFRRRLRHLSGQRQHHD